MTRLRILSDVHAEIAESSPELLVPPLATGDDSYSVLVIAGDLGTARSSRNTLIPYLEEWSSRFAYVIFVPGNHEFYGSEFYEAEMHLRETCSRFINVEYSTVLGRCLTREGVYFVCTPLFCDLSDPLAAYFVEKNLNDFRQITIRAEDDTRLIRAEDYNSFFRLSEEFLEVSLFGDRDVPPPRDPKRTVVVTHWTPSYRSVHSRFEGSYLNAGFSSQLDDMVERSGVALWVHGHTHDSFDYEIGDTRVLCNPLGYPNENPLYDPTLTVDI